MTRPLRIEIPNGVYHVTSRGLERRSIVRSQAHRQRWLEMLATVCLRRAWRVFAWVLMDNHFHLFLETPHADLSAGMHDLNSGYATYYNKAIGRNGPVFQGRFKGILVEREKHYGELSRYIHLNPVRAGLVRRVSDYSWSSCRAYFDARFAPPWLAWRQVLSEHGLVLRRARDSYRKFLHDGVASGVKDPLAAVVASCVLGSRDFVDKVTELLRERPFDREIPSARVLANGPDVATIERLVCRQFETSPESLRRKGRHSNDARKVAVFLCRRLTPTSVVHLGARFGEIAPSGVSRICAEVSDHADRDRPFARRLGACEKTLRQTV